MPVSKKRKPKNNKNPNKAKKYKPNTKQIPLTLHFFLAGVAFLASAYALYHIGKIFNVPQVQIFLIPMFIALSFGIYTKHFHQKLKEKLNID